MQSCDRWEPTPFCQVNSKSSVYFPFISGASDLTQALSVEKSIVLPVFQDSLFGTLAWICFGFLGNELCVTVGE